MKNTIAALDTLAEVAVCIDGALVGLARTTALGGPLLDAIEDEATRRVVEAAQNGYTAMRGALGLDSAVSLARLAAGLRDFITERRAALSKEAEEARKASTAAALNLLVNVAQDIRVGDLDAARRALGPLGDVEGIGDLPTRGAVVAFEGGTSALAVFLGLPPDAPFVALHGTLAGFIRERRAALAGETRKASLSGSIAPALEGPPDILAYFAWAHLTERLQAVSKPFADLAVGLVEAVPASAERTVALRKLLEAKDAAVRAALPSGDPSAVIEAVRAAREGA